MNQQYDGFYYDEQGKRLCEDCWKPIPKYRDFPDGLVSPESDGDRGGNGAKTRKTAIEGKDATEALRKAVCLDCYQAAFQRFYPGAPLAEMSRVIRETTERLAPEPVQEAVYIGEPQS